jgi:hypothetical protein
MMTKYWKQREEVEFAIIALFGIDGTIVTAGSTAVDELKSTARFSNAPSRDGPSWPERACS